MNIVRRVGVFGHRWGLEFLLAAAVLLLVGQLSWPQLVRWWRLPSPGTIGFDQFDAPTIAGDYLIYLPESYSDTKNWPLILFLHGSGERGNDPRRLRRQEPLGRKLPAVVVMPQCLPSCSWEPQALAGLVESVASRYKVDRDRIYLVGFSMGATGVWYTAASHPELFAAIVPIAGGGNPADAKALRDLPVWAFHGAEDKTVPVEGSQRMIDALHREGSQARLTILPGKGHGIRDLTCGRADLWKWLLVERKPN